MMVDTAYISDVVNCVIAGLLVVPVSNILHPLNELLAIYKRSYIDHTSDTDNNW